LSYVARRGRGHVIRLVNHLELIHDGALLFASKAIKQAKIVAQFVGKRVKKCSGIGQDGIDDDGGVSDNLIMARTISG
jgi:hypothetical protein